MPHLRGRSTADAGVTMVEMLVVLLITGLLAAITTPIVIKQRASASDITVQTDLRGMVTAADRFFNGEFKYPTTISGFATDGTTLAASDKNTFRAFTVQSGANAGYVVYGMNADTQHVYVVSSYGSKTPAMTALVALPSTPPTAGTYGVGVGITPATWVSTDGISSVLVTVTRVPFLDPTFINHAKTLLSTGNLDNIRQYTSPSTAWRIVDDASPVASQAVEFVTDIAGSAQGVWVAPASLAASWPSSQPKVAAVGESWTYSAWVKGTAGTLLRIAPRFMDSTGGSVTSGTTPTITMTGSWQRVSATQVADATMVGKYVGVLLINTSPFAAGQAFRFTGVQVDRAATASTFALSPTL